MEAVKESDVHTLSSTYSYKRSKINYQVACCIVHYDAVCASTSVQ